MNSSSRTSPSSSPTASDPQVSTPLAGLTAARGLLHKLTGEVCGNDTHLDAETATFFRGYNVVLRRHRNAAADALPAFDDALAAADALYEACRAVASVLQDDQSLEVRLLVAECERAVALSDGSAATKTGDSGMNENLPEGQPQ